MLLRAKILEAAVREFAPLSIGMALEPEEEEYLFQLAHKKREWLVCYCASLLTNATTAGPGELRHLQVKDIDLKARVMHVRRGVKNRFRVRVLPLNDDAAWAADQLLNRYRAMCTKYHIPEDPNHYILYHRGAKSKRTGRKPNPGGKPGIDKAQKLSWESRTCPYCQGRFATSFRLEGHIKADHPEIPQAPSEPKPMPDPTRPMGVWRSAWESLRKELAKKYPHLAKLRRYDLRHNAATKMLEDPSLSERVVEEMLGHKINSQIKDRYSHIRLERKWKAAQVLEGHHVPPPEPPQPVSVAQAPAVHPAAHGFGVVNGGKVTMMPERKPWH